MTSPAFPHPRPPLYQPQPSTETSPRFARALTKYECPVAIMLT